jgi:hypothetical protein
MVHFFVCGDTTLLQDFVHSRHKVSTSFSGSGLGNSQTVTLLESMRPGSTLDRSWFRESSLLKSVGECFLKRSLSELQETFAKAITDSDFMFGEIVVNILLLERVRAFSCHNMVIFFLNLFVARRRCVVSVILYLSYHKIRELIKKFS